jgi:hypothetical protein
MIIREGTRDIEKPSWREKQPEEEISQDTLLHLPAPPSTVGIQAGAASCYMYKPSTIILISSHILLAPLDSLMYQSWHRNKNDRLALQTASLSGPSAQHTTLSPSSHLRYLS